MSQPPKTSWPQRAGALLASGWPNQCAVCRSATRGREQRLCADCIDRFAPEKPRCRLCALTMAASVEACGRCLRDPPPWSRAVTACDYAYPWDGLLGALKFHAALDLAPALSALLGSRLRRTDTSLVHALLPVPLSDARLRERGYNQATLLARSLGAALGVPVRDDWLLRIVNTPHQTGLSRERRIANLRGAFIAEPKKLRSVRDRRIALLDDVMTTGATLAAATRALLDAGAADVQVWVVARTPDWRLVSGRSGAAGRPAHGARRGASTIHPRRIP